MKTPNNMKLENTINILENLGLDEKLSIQERIAVNEACLSMKRLKHINSENHDFQGWPIEKLTMKELRKFVKDNCALDDEAKLHVYQDDGMAYGAVNGYCSDLYIDEDNDGNKEVRIWF